MVMTVPSGAFAPAFTQVGPISKKSICIFSYCPLPVALSIYLPVNYRIGIHEPAHDLFTVILIHDYIIDPIIFIV